MQVVSSRNLFIDSSADVEAGDNFVLELSNNTIRAQDGQALKLTLLQFNCYANWYLIDTNNNKATLTTSQRASNIAIPRQNYATCGAIAKAFAEQVMSAALADARLATGNPGLSV